MIHETKTRKELPAVTSDHWHVIHARWSGNEVGRPLFDRSIISEHEDRAAAVAAGRALGESLGARLEQPPARRDQILIRRPNYKSLKTGPQLTPKRR